LAQKSVKIRFGETYTLEKILHMTRLCSFLLVGTLLVLSGCAVPPAADRDAPKEVRLDRDFLLTPGDKVKLVVFGEDSLTGEYMIDPRGIVTIPMVGEIEAAGLSEAGLQWRVKQMFVSRGFLSRPLVTADIQTMRPFYILGEVKNPGSYIYQPGMDVFKAIATAGGYTPRAAKRKILIDRWQEVQKLQMNADHNTPILPGDSITVRERIF
jgi:protein involved in polysaccharide export with SLBB domain